MDGSTKRGYDRTKGLTDEFLPGEGLRGYPGEGGGGACWSGHRDGAGWGDCKGAKEM